MQLPPVKQWDTMVTPTKDVHRVARFCDQLSISKLTNGIGSTCDLAIQGRIETFSRQEVLRDFSKRMLGVLSEIRKLGVTTSASLQHLETGRPVHLPRAHSLNSWDGKGLCKYNKRMLGTFAKGEGLNTPLKARA